jgi:hypothetical protein
MNEIIIDKNYNDIIFTMSLLDIIINKSNIESNLYLKEKKYLKYKFKYNKLKYLNLN